MVGTVIFENTYLLPPKDDGESQHLQFHDFLQESEQGSAYPPMQRRSHTKSRNGCHNCRTRRLKCDEGKPHCSKCTKSSKYKDSCDYPKVRTPPVKARRLGPLVPREANDDSGVISKTRQWSPEVPSVNLIKPLEAIFNNQTDFQYFTFFRTKTARNLSGFFDDDIWDRLILQACHQEEFARNAVVAIAALHKTTILNAGNKNIEHHTYALHQYSKALKQMSRSIGDIDPTTTTEHQLRLMLVSALLTTCFECYHGNHSAVVSQSSSALRLLFTVQEHISNRGDRKMMENDEADRGLVSVFARLEISAMVLTKKEIYPQDNTAKGRNDDATLAAMPTLFTTLREARFYWDILSRRSTAWRTSYGYKLYENEYNPDIPRRPAQVAALLGRADHNLNFEAMIGTEVPPHRLKRLEVQLATYWSSFHLWCAAFTPFYDTARLADKGSADYQGATFLMICMQAAGLNSAVADPQAPVDLFSSDILGHIKELLHLNQLARSADGDERTSGMFQFDPCLIHHLWLIATRSHDRYVRREAVFILKNCKRREGLLDSDVVGRMSAWVGELDEAEDEGKEDAGRRMARLVVSNEEFDFEKRWARVRCRKIDVEGGFTPVLTLHW